MRGARAVCCALMLKSAWQAQHFQQQRLRLSWQALICQRCKTKVGPLQRSRASKRPRCGTARKRLELGEPLQRSYSSKRSRFGAVRMCLALGEPSAEIVRVEALSPWPRANVSRAQRTLCRDRACPRALAVAPCECVSSSANPRRSCASKRSRCGAVRSAKCESRSRSSGSSSKFATARFFKSGCKMASFISISSTRSALPQLRLESRNFWVQK